MTVSDRVSGVMSALHSVTELAAIAWAWVIAACVSASSPSVTVPVLPPPVNPVPAVTPVIVPLPPPAGASTAALFQKVLAVQAAAGLGGQFVLVYFNTSPNTAIKLAAPATLFSPRVNR